MPDGGAAEAALTADYNAEMLEHRARHRWVRDRSIFVGSPGRRGARRLRARACRASASGPRRTSTSPATSPVSTRPEVADRDRLRADLGYAADAPLCVVTVGGSGVGTPLAAAGPRRGAAGPTAGRGPAVPRRGRAADRPGRACRDAAGVTVRGMVPDLYKHLAAADLAVVQGGLTTCMELTASRTPFLYVPLRHHFEQNFHVRHRLERYRAGPAAALRGGVRPGRPGGRDRREPRSRPWTTGRSRTDGAARAAELIAELL